MANILVIYYSLEHPLRGAVADHLYSFARCADHNCVYLNLAVRRPPSWLRRVPFDLIIFHTIFLWQRVEGEIYERLLSRVAPIRNLSGLKVVLPQDEYLHSEKLCAFILEFDIDVVCSVAPPSEWPKIYEGIGPKTRITDVLTGYLDEKTLSRIDRIRASVQNRSIDIGYRARRATPRLGRHGMLKTRIAEVFKEAVLGTDLKVDISLRAEDTLYGDDWYRFLLQSKYAIGVEGGASLLDRDGSIRENVEAHLLLHPDATFDELEARYFSGLDGSLQYFALSPRNLEACATGTCQVLVEGEYGGVLKPGLHYIELRRDFSNLDKVITAINDDNERVGITERAYHAVVKSGLYTYSHFVRTITALVPEERRRESFISLWLLRWGRVADHVSWLIVGGFVAPWRRLQKSSRRWVRRVAIRLLPEKVVMGLKHYLQKKRSS